jgi:predicted nucleic acid-binding protein
MDIAIAATAIAHGAGLWTLNPNDFAAIPGLKLVKP